MGTILSVIGLFVVIKFCIRNRRIIMNKDAFCASVKQLRQTIQKSYGKEFAHAELDDIVHNVLGEPEMESIENLESDLAEHIVRHIRAIKQAKEQDALKTKAEKIIEQIKTALDE